MHRRGKLPGLVRGARLVTLIDVPEHMFRHPHIIGL